MAKEEKTIKDKSEYNQEVSEEKDVNHIKRDGSINFIGTGDGFKDEDDMASDSPVAVASQQSIKKYVDDENLWEIDGSETQLKTADEIDMQTKKIINVVDPTTNQEVATKIYVDVEAAKTQLLAASDNLKASADTERNRAGAGWAKKKEIRVRVGGVVRVKFDLKSGTASTNVKGRIYVNGVAVGTEKVTDLASYTTYSEDITIKTDDDVQFYGFDTAATGYVRNFRLYWDKGSAADFVVNTD